MSQFKHHILKEVFYWGFQKELWLSVHQFCKENSNMENIVVQGEPLKSTAPKFSKYKIPSKLAQNFSKYQKLKIDFVLWKFRGV